MDIDLRDVYRPGEGLDLFVRLLEGPEGGLELFERRGNVNVMLGAIAGPLPLGMLDFQVRVDRRRWPEREEETLRLMLNDEELLWIERR